jgi:hypothetical protein
VPFDIALLFSNFASDTARPSARPLIEARALAMAVTNDQRVLVVLESLLGLTAAFRFVRVALA